jgi:hypothetical protein
MHQDTKMQDILRDGWLLLVSRETATRCRVSRLHLAVQSAFGSRRIPEESALNQEEGDDRRFIDLGCSG